MTAFQTNIFFQFGCETVVLALMTPYKTSILELPSLPFGNEAKLEGFLWSHQSIKVPISHLPKLL